MPRSSCDKEPDEEEDEEEDKATAKKMTMMTTKTKTVTRSERPIIYFGGRRMKHEHFVKVVEATLDSGPLRISQCSAD